MWEQVIRGAYSAGGNRQEQRASMQHGWGGQANPLEAQLLVSFLLLSLITRGSYPARPCSWSLRSKADAPALS